MSEGNVSRYSRSASPEHSEFSGGETESLHRKYAKYQAQNNKLHERLSELSSKMESLQRQLNDKDNVLSTLQRSLFQCQIENRSYQSKCKSLQKQLQEDVQNGWSLFGTQRKTNNNNNNNNTSEGKQSLEMQALQDELMHKIRLNEQLHERCEDLSAQIQRLQQSEVTLKSQFDSITQQMQRERVRHEAELIKAKQIVKKSHDEPKTLQEVIKLKSEIAELQQEIKRLQNQNLQQEEHRQNAERLEQELKTRPTCVESETQTEAIGVNIGETQTDQDLMTPARCDVVIETLILPQNELKREEQLKKFYEDQIKQQNLKINSLEGALRLSLNAKSMQQLEFQS
ncbi:hypothetical protein MP228_009953 [Amoeboaphelidium protococcarum]|nr:hypothetical protein MP228_009953 [Amoeboaphelidium protococcarum]